MKLADLRPRLSPPGTAYQELAFSCPRCQGHEILVAIWGGAHGDVEVPLAGLPDSAGARGVKRLWHAEQGPAKDWGSLSLAPSIDRTGMDPCGGWHGFITNGECTP